MSDRSHGELATPLVGQKFADQQQSVAGIVKMWSGRLMEAQKVRRDLEQQLGIIAAQRDRILKQHELALSLMTDEQLERLTEAVRQDVQAGSGGQQDGEKGAVG